MPGAGWLQAELELRGRDAEALHRVFTEVFALVGGLRREGPLRHFFFVRKAPGLRLRFALRGDAESPARAIEAALDGLRARRLLRRWLPVVYEPETYKFGGPGAMQAVHSYFDADTRAWWRWERMRHAERTSIDARLLSMTVLNDLFSQCLEGPEEVWDVWCRLAALHGGTEAGRAHGARAWCIADLADRVSPGERAVLRQYSLANAAVARRFASIRSRGRMLFGHRLVLPHAAIYHWNRYGFAPSERAAIYTEMQDAWSPFKPA
jgi:protein-L-isoaspartate(D-aspartate) O-methyltransferase